MEIVATPAPASSAIAAHDRLRTTGAVTAGRVTAVKYAQFNGVTGTCSVLLLLLLLQTLAKVSKEVEPFETTT